MSACSSAIVICSPAFGPRAPSTSVFHLESELLHARLSPWTEGAAPRVSVFALDADTASALRTECRFQNARVQTLGASAANGARSVTATLLEGLHWPASGSAHAAQSAAEQHFPDGGITGSIASHASESAAPGVLSTDDGVRSWLAAHQPQAAFDALHPAAWSAYDVAAWMESFGRRWQPFASQACKQRLDGRALAGVASAELASWLAAPTASGGVRALTDAMAERATRDIRQRVRACDKVAVDPALSAFASPLYRFQLDGKSVSGVRPALQELCELQSVDGNGSVPLDVLWEILQMLGLTKREAREACTHFPLENTHWVRFEAHLDLLGAAVDRSMHMRAQQ